MILLALQVILGIGFLIFIHEAGHYLAARLAGVRVEIFSLGFGPRVWGFRRGETDYRLSALPLGGYVQVTGMDPTVRNKRYAADLQSKGFGARALFYSGGVIMNLLFAMIAFPLIFRAGVEFDAPVLGEIQEGGAAWRARLQPGDRILKINGADTYSFNAMVNDVALAGRRPIKMLVERDGRQFDVEVLPQYSKSRGLQLLGAERALNKDKVLIESVDSDSPAYSGGLRPGDRIVAIDGKPISRRHYSEWQASLLQEPNKEAWLTVDRDGERQEVRFRPKREKTSSWKIGVSPASRTIASVRDTAEKIGFQPGDILVLVNQQPFGGKELPLEAMRQRNQQVFVVRRAGETEPVQLTANLNGAELDQLNDRIAFAQDDIRQADDFVGLRLAPTKAMPAMAAGLRRGDRILRIGDQRIQTWEQLTEAVQADKDKTLDFVVLPLDGGEGTGLPFRTLSIKPKQLEQIDMGFVPEFHSIRQLYKKDTFGGALRAGMVASMDLIKQLYLTFKKLLTGEVAAKNLGGIITISRVTYHFAREGWAQFFWLLGLISVNLAFINILPIPILDGGSLMFLLIERIKGSPVSSKVFNYSQVLGLVFILALLVFVTYHDILKWLG